MIVMDEESNSERRGLFCIYVDVGSVIEWWKDRLASTLVIFLSLDDYINIDVDTERSSLLIVTLFIHNIYLWPPSALSFIITNVIRHHQPKC